MLFTFEFFFFASLTFNGLGVKDVEAVFRVFFSCEKFVGRELIVLGMVVEGR